MFLVVAHPLPPRFPPTEAAVVEARFGNRVVPEAGVHFWKKNVKAPQVIEVISDRRHLHSTIQKGMNTLPLKLFSCHTTASMYLFPRQYASQCPLIRHTVAVLQNTVFSCSECASLSDLERCNPVASVHIQLLLFIFCTRADSCLHCLPANQCRQTLQVHCTMMRACTYRNQPGVQFR